MENFIVKVISLVFLYRSEEFQIFIKETRDYSKVEFYNETNIEISEKYQRTFPHVSLSEPDEEYISSSIIYFKSTQEKLSKFQQTCTQTVENYENFARSLAGLLDKLNEAGKYLAEQEETVKLREECINPYGIIHD